MTDTTDLVVRLEGLGAALKPFADFGDLLAEETEGISDLDQIELTFESSNHLLDRLYVVAFRPAAEAITALPALLAAVREGEWRPIESAPKDGWGPNVIISGLLESSARYVEESYWVGSPSSGYWSSHKQTPPTHWRPLPSPPTHTNTEGSNGS